MSRPASPPNPMYIICRRRGEVIIDDRLDPNEIHTPPDQICCDQQPGAAQAEVVDGSSPGRMALL